MSIQNVISTGVWLTMESAIRYLDEVEKLNFERLGSEPDPTGIQLVYKPTPGDIHEEWIGEPVYFRVICYGRDNYYEAFLVEFIPDSLEPSALFKHLKTLDKPVILISSSAKKPRGASINNLRFWPLEVPFYLNGAYDVVTKNGKPNKE